jgi:hypothetical protein
MMLKVIVYAYSEKVYSSRRIAKALRENVNFTWISGRSQPDFRTINHFRSSRMKGVIDDVFASVMEYLVEQGYVKLENYFVDGTKIEANANKHKVVWEKRRHKYHGRLQEKIRELLKEIDEVNAAENAEYGDQCLVETGGSGTGGGMDAAKLAEKMAAAEPAPGRAVGKQVAQAGGQDDPEGLSAAAGEVRRARTQAGWAQQLRQDRRRRHLYADEGRSGSRETLGLPNYCYWTAPTARRSSIITPLDSHFGQGPAVDTRNST